MKICSKTKLIVAGLLAVLFLGAAACEDQSDYMQQPVAAYDGRVLTRADLNRLLPEQFDSPEDSARVAEMRIEEWQKNEVIAKKAISRLDEVEERLAPMVRDYRRKLLVEAMYQYIYENLVNNQVTQQELEAYYKKNIEQFIATETLFDVHYIKTRKEDLNNIVSLMSTNVPQAKAELLEWAKANAEEYILDNHFITGMEIVPMEKEIGANLSGVPPSEQVYTFVSVEQDTVWRHLFKMRRVVGQGDYIPLDAVQEKVRRIVLSERRNAAIKEFESNAYEEARAAKEFELP